MAFGKLAHIRMIGKGDPGWGQTQRWHMQGQTPSVSLYDAPYGANDSNVGDTISAGRHTMRERLPLDEPTLNRSARVSAQLNSLPAARFFGGYVSSGTGQHWSGATTAHTTGTLHKSFNRNAQGAAELHPATVYDPFPSPSSLYPKVV